MVTKTESLRGKIGKPVACEICNEQKIYTEGWYMTEGKLLVCPDCLPIIEKSGKIIVNI